VRLFSWLGRLLPAFFLLFLSAFGAAHAAPWMGYLNVYDPNWNQGRVGNYGTVKYFLDESAGETIPIVVDVQVYADGSPPQDLEVQVFSNVNRRDFAKVFESANDAGQPNSYYVTYPMSVVASANNNHVYRANLTLSKAGAYRLTTRFRIQGGPWIWHNQFVFDGVQQRDLAVVVSPKKTLSRSIYEVNTLVVEATPGGGAGQRSTLEDFTDRDTDGYDPFNIGFVRNTLGFNTVWLMPIFPNTQVKYNKDTGQDVPNDSPGSPYSTRNYFAVNGLFDETGDPAQAMNEFVHFVNQADAIGLDVFIDVAFNHSGRDTVFGQGAAEAGLVPPAQVNSRIRDVRPAWATNRNNFRDHAHQASDWAPFAPADRLGEHYWDDAGLDWFFGNYSSLGPKPGPGVDTSQGGALDERDLVYTDLDPAGGHDHEVVNVWNYFAAVLGFWLDRTGNRLDGIRADFAQGLPPQAWEYIINKTRQKKWDFVFLAEVLDPDQVRYRMNRQFDIITTVDHELYRKDDVTTTQLVSSLEAEASLFGYNAAILHNGTSHDEKSNGNLWLMTARYAVAASLYGVPMVYMSQPLGVPDKVDFRYSWQNIKSFWDGANPAALTMYRRINDARQGSPALRGTDRWFLTRRNGGGFNENVFAVARWSGEDVVLAFVNLRDQGVSPDVFAVPGGVPLDGSPGVRYQAFNLVADNPNSPLWPQPRTAADIYANGVYVAFGFPNETQYLRLRKVP
jgi:glycosidase